MLRRPSITLVLGLSILAIVMLLIRDDDRRVRRHHDSRLQVLRASRGEVPETTQALVQLHPDTRIPCHVSWLPDTQPVSGAIVYFDDASGVHRHVQCDANGLTTLDGVKEGTSVYAIAPGGFNLLGRAQTSSSTPDEVWIQISREMTITGIVRDEVTGQGIDPGQVYIDSCLEIPHELRRHAYPKEPFIEVPLQRGYFQIKGVLATDFEGRPMEYCLIASSPEYSSRSVRVSAAAGSVVALDIGLVRRVTPQVSISGTVLGPDRRPVPGAFVSVIATSRSRGGSFRRESEESVTDSSGRFELGLQDFDGQIAADGAILADVVVQVRADGTAGARVKLDTTRTPLRIHLARGTLVHGRVLNDNGIAVPNAVVSFFVEDPIVPALGEHPLVSITADGGGWFDAVLDPSNSYSVLSHIGDLAALDHQESVICGFAPESSRDVEIHIRSLLDASDLRALEKDK